MLSATGGCLVSCLVIWVLRFFETVYSLGYIERFLRERERERRYTCRIGKRKINKTHTHLLEGQWPVPNYMYYPN